MQGLYIRGKRPSSKKEVIAAVAEQPEEVSLEVTSFFGNQLDGPIVLMEKGSSVSCVGPDPYKKRNFYLTIKRLPDGRFKVE